MSTFTFRYLSPEERQAYQRELLRILETRNESLAKRWGVDRADRCTALKTTLGDFRGVSPAHLREETEHEFYLAGQELLSALRKAVQ